MNFSRIFSPALSLASTIPLYPLRPTRPTKLHTVEAVRLVLEPKPGLPTDPNNPRAFSGIFSDVSGLFVINNESGWYEGWMIHDITVPEVAYKVGYDPDSYVAFFGKVLEEERRSAGS